MNVIEKGMKERLTKDSAMDENGFSLLELVVSVGILITLSVGGLATGYSEFRTEQKENATEILAKAVYGDALQNERGFDENYTAEDAVMSWTETADREDMTVTAGTGLSVPETVDENGEITDLGSPACVWVKVVNDDGFEVLVESEDACSEPVVEDVPEDAAVIVGSGDSDR